MIDLRSLRYIVALAKRRSYARAAEELGISQPALTRTVQNLEQQFGVRLFDRDRAGVNPTPQGQAMLDSAAVVLVNAEDLERQWRSTASGQAGVIRFGMAPMPARALLAAAIRERLLAAPAVRNDVVVRNVEALWPLLVSGEIEFFVAAEGQVPDAPPVRAETLGRFPVSLIVRSGHPLLSGKRDGSKYAVVVSSRSGLALPPGLQEYAEGLPHVIEDFEVLATLAATTDVIWQSSSFAVAKEIKAGLLEELPRHLGKAETQLRIMSYSLERRSQSPLARSLIKVFRERIVALSSR